MSERRNTWRLFVAVYPPPESARAMQDAMRQLDLPDHRETAPEQVHMTLQFVGDTPVSGLEDVKESVERAASGLEVTMLTPTRLITLPQRGRARLVAAETDAPPAILELQRRLASRLAQKPRARPGDRFLPHLTLCRFRAPARLDPVDVPLRLPPFPVTVVRLMRSTLHRDGARHEAFASVPLRSPA